MRKSPKYQFIHQVKLLLRWDDSARNNRFAGAEHLQSELVIQQHSRGFMAGKKAISVSQFVEHFRRAWLGTQEKFYSGRSLDRNDFNQLPRRLGT